MKIFMPPPKDFDTVKELSVTKRCLTERIYNATRNLDLDCPEFARYWSDVSPVNRDLFIANIVESICK